MTHTESQLKAGDTVSITSGRDTSLKGAQVSGETVKVDAGRNLTLQSEQDRNNYDSKQTSVSASGSFTFGTMTGSGSVSASKSKIDSDYTSVQEQTGFFAGKGGFDITVGEHTQLKVRSLARLPLPIKTSWILARSASRISIIRPVLKPRPAAWA
ncbi:hypothetical protein DVP94_22580 [Yersinia enterocolitica]|nr:hypothetical protein [Yersinia enterocolitica]EKN6098323.1 hypothetical protein [Yersinia enterocolitica]EKN6263315.1 hypothetical protein [Yersinia enterocolitica]